jgi:hypothetical protein
MYGQISTREEPISFYTDVPVLELNEKTHKVMPPLDMSLIEQEDAEDEVNGMPPRFGYKHEVNYNLENSGEWINLPDGGRIWRLSILCPEALSINLLYDKFWLPGGAKFFIYSNDHRYSIGAFSSANNKGDSENIQGFATGLVYGNRITLEYYLPSEIENMGIISIIYVVHGYRAGVGFGESGRCNTNVNCPEGQNWQNEKNAVARILVNGNRWCSGSLINTTANDARPLFLTAAHCVLHDRKDAMKDSNLMHWSFEWHYESPDCDNGIDFMPPSTSGAVLIANDIDYNNNYSDFALLKLKEDPALHPEVTPYYLGWDRSGNAGIGGVGIHHPGGDIKKISIYTTAPESVKQGGACNSHTPYFPDVTGKYWKIVWNKGVTEVGSSGSPLINNDRRVIGQLCDGCSFCIPPRDKWPDGYGKFSVSWTGSGTTENKRKLQPWLDPIGTGAFTMDGRDCTTTFFTIKTVNTNQAIKGCVIYSKDVKVTNGAKLIFEIDREVTIDGDFEVELGSEFEIK